MVTRRSRKACWCVGLGLALGAIGCGDESDPDAITNLELKSPTGLEIIDNGEGKVTLTWYTSNPEEDFEGYNIYGGQLSDSDLTTIGVTEGDPIKLLDTDGEPVAAVKSTILPKFDYTSSNTAALPGAAAAPSSDEEETELSKLPIHVRNSADSTDPLLPTCRPASGTCTIVSTADEVDAENITSNGVVSFDLGATMQLTEGKQYCFFVLSVQNEGTEVSESSSNVACVTPRFKTTFSKTISGNSHFDIRTFLAACDATTHTCGTPTFSDTSSNLRFQTDSTNSTTFINGLTGAAIYIRRMGAFSTGFAEFTDVAPAFSYDSTGVEHGGGYSIAGQSVQLEPYGMYAIAVGSASTDTDASKFYYHYLWVNSSSPSYNTAINFELRMSNVLTDR